jgi:hypothetical protein
MGEEMANMLSFEGDGPLSRSQLEALRKRLASMSMTALDDFYYAAWTMCKPERGKPPRAPFVQQLVQAWKEMMRRSH